MPRYNDPCIFVGCFYPAGSLAQASTLASARLPFALPKDFTAAAEDVFRRNPGHDIVLCMGFSQKPAFDFLSTDGYIPLTGKTVLRLRYPFFRQQGFLFLHWHKMECLSGERRADRQGNRHENGSAITAFTMVPGKRFSIHRSKASDCTESGGVSMITASPLRI